MYYWISTLREFMILSFYFCSLETLEITIYLRGARGRLALPPMKDSLKFLDRNDIYFLLHGIYTHLQGFHAGNNSSVISAGGRFHTKPQG
jgi:hypothetical protein